MIHSTLPFRMSFNTFKWKWDRLVSKACDPYRPELHYMRGPGPKWRTKHQSLPRIPI
jgi:hypothetical protein